MKFVSVALLTIASVQVAYGYPQIAPCHQQQAPCHQQVPVHVNNPHIPCHQHQPVQHHLPVFVVEDPSHEVLLIEEPARELVVIDTNDEPTALERILRILRKTGCAVRRVGDILAQDAGDELGLDDYGCGNAQAVAHTVINLGHPYVPNCQDDIVVIEPPTEEIIVQTPHVVPVPTPVVQQPVAVIPQQAPCHNQVHYVTKPHPTTVHQTVPINQIPSNHHVHVAHQHPVQHVQHVQHVQPVQHVQHVHQPVQAVQHVQPVHHMQPKFVETERYPCDDEVAVFRQPLPVPTKYTYSNKY